MEYSGETEGFSKLGREIKVSPKSLVRIVGVGIELRSESRSVIVDVMIGVHKAAFVMSEDAWRALNAGEDIIIQTEQQYRALVNI